MRIQILPLPSVVKGDDVEEPFAIVVDQWRSPLPSEAFMAAWYKFRDECGAKAVFVTEDTVEIVDRYAEPQPAPVTVNMEDTLIKDYKLEKLAQEFTREIERLRSKGLWP